MKKEVERRVGGKDNQSTSRTERQPDTSTSFLRGAGEGTHFPHIGGKQDTKV